MTATERKKKEPYKTQTQNVWTLRYTTRLQDIAYLEEVQLNEPTVVCIHPLEHFYKK